jgi:hypothetical protein
LLTRDEARRSGFHSAKLPDGAVDADMAASRAAIVLISSWVAP